ncbi:TPA: CpaF family protein, partial [Candidatus Micrarchaeota archaeon]|nr:CpaF family protein [Candidatus Micrarchaeota archaeon]
MGQVIEENDVATIYQGWPYPLYSLKRYPFTAAEEELFRAIVDVLLKKNSIVYVKFKVLPEDAEKKSKETFRDEVLLKIPPQTFSKLPKEEEKKQIVATVAEYLLKFDVQNPKKLAEEIVNTVFGLGVLEKLLNDDSLEEVMVNGENRPVFVFHRRIGMCKTDVYLSKEEIIRYIKKVAVWVNKAVSERNPLLDAHLPNGDRFNATLPPVSILGPTITIRKF